MLRSLVIGRGCVGVIVTLMQPLKMRRGLMHCHKVLARHAGVVSSVILWLLASFEENVES